MVGTYKSHAAGTEVLPVAEAIPFGFDIEAYTLCLVSILGK
jgi:hypothetical protein